MAFKIAVFGVRDNEVPYFHDLNKYNYDLTLVPENLSLASSMSSHEQSDTVTLIYISLRNTA